MSSEREIMTFTGKMFDFLKPDPKTICIEDIAHHLACINRYTGATRVPYSVAEHCVRCSYLPIGDPLLNLMHDSAEAYIGDIPRPQKQDLCWYFNDGGLPLSYKVVEAEIMRQMGEALDIPGLKGWLATPKDTKRADNIMMATEVRDLMPPQAKEQFGDWMQGIDPSPQVIHPWPWDVAKFEFLCRYKELRG